MVQVIPETSRHSIEQIENIEEQCRRIINQNATDRRTNFFMLSELAQHGSPVFPEFEQYVATHEKHPRAVAFRQMNKSVHEQTFSALNASGAMFNENLRRKLYHPQYPVYFGARNSDLPLVVIFTTTYNNFYISNPAFAEMLARSGFSFLFVKDPSGYQYMRGIAGISSDWNSSITWLGNLLAEKKGKKKVIFAGFSSSGFASLLAAMHVPPDLAIGFSVTSTMASESDLPSSKLITPEIYADIPGELKCDLVTKLAGHSFPIRLYFGEYSRRDKSHAVRFADLKQVEVYQIQEDAHCCFRPLLQEGHFLSLFSL